MPEEIPTPEELAAEEAAKGPQLDAKSPVSVIEENTLGGIVAGNVEKIEGGWELTYISLNGKAQHIRVTGQLAEQMAKAVLAPSVILPDSNGGAQAPPPAAG